MNLSEFTEIQDLLKLFTLSSWAVGFYLADVANFKDILNNYYINSITKSKHKK